jgi:bifunctional non-homologous end joining protein LigD
VRVTNPSKIYFPEKGIEKARVVGYYRAVSSALLPHVSGRPVTVERFPDGIHGKHFFQWNVPPQMPAWMRTLAFKDEVEGRTKRGFLIDDVASLLYVANLGSIPIHVFSCRAESLAVCNYVAIDFDVKLSSLRVAVKLAHTLRQVLEAIGLRGFPKTSGQTGLHVLVPLGEGHGYDTARALVELLGRLLVHAHPDLATMERAPAKRGAKVYVDTVQTGPTRSLAAAYSLRAVPEATVSTPLEWSDVVPELDPRAFTLETVPKLVESRICPMESFFRVVPDVPTAVRKLADVWGRAT